MAGSPGGKSVGRVSIRVLPDSSKFREDLKKVLNRVEATMSVSIPVMVDEKSKEQFKRDVDKLVKDANGKNANIDVNAKTKSAKLALAVLTRARTAIINAKVSKKSLAIASATLARLSGARVAADWVKDLIEELGNLDKTLPRFLTFASGISSIVSLIASSISGLVGIGAGIAAIAPSLLILPGLLGGAILSLGVLVVALRDAKKQLVALKPAFRELKKIIQTDFWAQARKPIVDLVQGLLPQLRFAFSETSSAIGGFIGDLANSFSKQFAGGRFQAIFAGIPDTFKILSTGTDAFAGAISSLGLVAAKWVPQLAQWFVNISFTFDKFLTDASTDGRLDGWIQHSIREIKNLGRSFAGIGRIFVGIWDAAERAGGGGLGGFADNLDRIQKTIRTPEFQQGLTKFFQGANSSTAEVGRGLSAIVGALGYLQDQMRQFLGTAGQIIGELLSGIAAAFQTPEVRDALSVAISDIQAGFKAFSDFIPTMSGPLSSLLGLVGKLAKQLGPVLGQTLSSLGTVLQPFLDYVSTNVLPVLGPALTDAIKKLTPKLADLAKQLGPLLGSLSEFAVKVLPPLVAGANAVLDGFNQLGTANGKDPWANSPIVNFLNNLGAGARNTLGAIQSVMDPDYWAGFIDPAAEARWEQKVRDGLYGPILQTTQQIQDNIGNFFDTLGGEFAHGWQQIQDGTAWAWGQLALIIGNGLVGWQKSWNTVLTTVQTALAALPGIVQAGLSNAGTWLVGIGTNLVAGLIAGFQNAIPALLNSLGNLKSLIIAQLKKLFGIASPSKVLKKQIGRWLPRGIAAGVDADAHTVVDSLRRAIDPSRLRVPDLSGLSAAAAGGSSVGDTFNANFAVLPQPGIPLADQVFSAANRLRARRRGK